MKQIKNKKKKKISFPNFLCFVEKNLCTIDNTTTAHNFGQRDRFEVLFGHLQMNQCNVWSKLVIFSHFQISIVVF